MRIPLSSSSGVSVCGGVWICWPLLLLHSRGTGFGKLCSEVKCGGFLVALRVDWKGVNGHALGVLCLS